MAVRVENEYGWTLITSHEMVELWQTCSGAYLVCYKYGGIFIFCRRLDEAKKEAKSLFEKLTKKPSTNH